MILHICPSRGELFTSLIIEFFEHINPKKNDYLILTNENIIIDLNKNVNIQIKRHIDNSYIKYIETKYKVIIVHKFESGYVTFLKKITKPIKIWGAFGGDILRVLYNYPLSHILLPKTIRVLCKLNIIYFLQLNIICQILLYPYKFLKRKRLRRSIKTFDYITTVIPEEYNLLKKSINPIGEYIAFNYSHFLFSDLNDEYFNGQNILIGNAASYDNNHIDAFSLIEHVELNDRCVVTPLSYGSSEYRDIVLSEGNKLFGSNYLPIMKILPPNDYKKILLSCSHIIIEGRNQHALGAILIGVYNGSKIFLNRCNPVFSYLRSLGALIFTTNDLQNNISEINTVLSVEQMIHNRKVVFNEHGSIAIKQRAIKMLIDIGYVVNN